MRVLFDAGEQLFPSRRRPRATAQAKATQRYSHIADDPLREATERFGEMFTGARKSDSADVVPLPKRRRKGA